MRMDTTQFAALIFDCDGTLADTMPAHFRAWTMAVRQFGLELPEERFYALGGIPVRKIVEILVAEAEVTVDVTSVVEFKEASYLSCLAAVGPVDPVVAIARAHRGRLPMAVASGSTRQMVELTLRQIGILDWFDCMVGAEDTERHKPDPDVFLEAARRLDVEPTACCVYEDTDTGVKAANRAGMHCVDVRSMVDARRANGS